MFTAADSRQQGWVFIGALQSQLEYSASCSFDCRSLWELLGFLRLLYGDIQEFLAYKTQWSLGPRGFSLSATVLLPLTLWLEHVLSEEQPSFCLLMKGVHHHLVSWSV